MRNDRLNCQSRVLFSGGFYASLLRSLDRAGDLECNWAFVWICRVVLVFLRFEGDRTQIQEENDCEDSHWPGLKSRHHREPRGAF